MKSATQTDQSGTWSGEYNGVTAKNVTFSYDADERLQNVNYFQGADTSTLIAATYAYDDDSNLTDLAYTTSTSTLAAYHWSYDTAGRVSHEYSLNDTADSGDLLRRLRHLGRNDLWLRQCQRAYIDKLLELRQCADDEHEPNLRLERQSFDFDRFGRHGEFQLDGKRAHDRRHLQLHVRCGRK